MSGQGKYTNYSDKIPEPEKGGTSSTKLQFLGKLFKGGPDLSMKAVLDRAKSFLVPSTQAADPTMFDGGNVSLDYANAPNMADVKWAKPGDPSTPYTPDVRSPGPVPGIDLGNTDTVHTNLTPADGDPGVTPADLSPNYIPGGPNTGTKSPDKTSVSVSSQELGANTGMSNVTGPGEAAELYK